MLTESTIQAFCPQCENERSIALVSKSETLPVLGEPTEYTATVYRCEICGTEFAPTDLEERNFKAAYDTYRRRHKLLLPEEIRSVRETYGLSQRTFSKFLGWGEITIHRYEAGAIQDVAHNETLALIKDDHRNALRILELNREHLSEDTARKLEKRIRDLLETEKGSVGLIVDLLGLYRTTGRVPSVNTGYREFDLERMENLILYVLTRLGGVFKTKLNKLLWYCDFKYFKENTVSITGAQYVHLPYGPIPDGYDLFLWGLGSERKISSTEVFFNETVSGEQLSAEVAPDESLFLQKEIETINYVIETLGHMTSKQISEKSHSEVAYESAKPSEVISYKCAVDLSI